MMGSWVEGSNMDETEAADLAATVEDDITDDTSIDGITIDAPDVSVVGFSSVKVTIYRTPLKFKF